MEMSQFKFHSTDIANKVTCRCTITPAISFSCGDNTAAYGVSFGPKYPPFLDVYVESTLWMWVGKNHCKYNIFSPEKHQEDDGIDGYSQRLIFGLSVPVENFFRQLFSFCFLPVAFEVGEILII